MDSKSSYESSDSNILNMITRMFFLKMSFGSIRSLVGISFQSFAPILENDFRSISIFVQFQVFSICNSMWFASGLIRASLSTDQKPGRRKQTRNDIQKNELRTTKFSMERWAS